MNRVCNAAPDAVAHSVCWPTKLATTRAPAVGIGGIMTSRMRSEMAKTIMFSELLRRFDACPKGEALALKKIHSWKDLFAFNKKYPWYGDWLRCEIWNDLGNHKKGWKASYCWYNDKYCWCTAPVSLLLKTYLGKTKLTFDKPTKKK